jgi:hypothetical protein
MNVPANSSVRRVGARPRRAPLRGVAVGVGAVVAMAQVATDVVAHGRLDPLYFDGADYHRLAAELAEHGTYGPPIADRPPGLLCAPGRSLPGRWHPPDGQVGP